MKRIAFVLSLCLLLSLLAPAFAEVSFAGLTFPEDAEYIDLASVTVTDFDAFEAFLDRFPNLTRVDMWATPMTASRCDRLASRYPAVQWGWTMEIRSKDHTHVIRTDDTSFSTLHNNKSAGHTTEDFRLLKYCWNLMALDIGHNRVDSLDWLSAFPNLRVLIVACNRISDISPLASLKHLEYAELFKNEIRDITPLRGLDHLMDLNLCFNRIEDLSVLKELPSLKRLWMFSCSRFNKEPPREIVSEQQELHPDLVIDTRHYPTNGRWRWLAEGKPDPHYKVIQQIFGSDHEHPQHQYIPFDDSAP